MSKRNHARSVADVGSGTIIAVVDIDAEPERIFRALCSPEIVEWWGAAGVYRTTEWTGDVRVGGTFRAGGLGADGKPFAVEGQYLEIDAPRKLVHTWRPDWDTASATTVTYRLAAVEGGTRVTLRHEGFTSEESCASHADGWSMVLGWLERFAAPPARARSFFMIRLVPPRPTFMMDMTPAEKTMMGQHAGYWSKLLDDGVAHAFGPVADPNGPYGVGIIEVEDRAAVASLEAKDPAILSGSGFRYEVLPMPLATVRA